MANDLAWDFLKNDALKLAVITNLKKCGIEISQMEIMVLELGCNFADRTNDPDAVTYKAACSEKFPDEIIKNNLNDLINSAELKELKNIRTKLDNGNNQDDLEHGNLCQEFIKKRQYFWSSFIKRNEEKFICNGKALDWENQKFLFLFVELREKSAFKYKKIIEYVLGEISENLESVEAIAGFLSSAFFSFKMPNKRALFGDYVDYFLKKNELPPAEVLIELSAEKYEGSESEARIYIDCQDVVDLEILDEVGEKDRIINSENRRMIRKMMEISKRGMVYLHAEREGEKGKRNCLIKKLVKGEKDKGLYIKFFGYLCWGIVYDGREEIIYERGQYILNSSENKEEYLAKIEILKEKIDVLSMPAKLKKWFDSNRIRNLVEILKEQKHGTAVILTNSSREVERLCRLNRGILIKEDVSIYGDESGWNKEQLLSLTSIDGALFMNLNGRCVAIGVIVDGVAKRKGNNGKGARYNSIVNYVRQKGKKNIYLGIIVSEDGMIELTCNLESEDAIC